MPIGRVVVLQTKQPFISVTLTPMPTCWHLTNRHFLHSSTSQAADVGIQSEAFMHKSIPGPWVWCRKKLLHLAQVGGPKMSDSAVSISQTAHLISIASWITCSLEEISSFEFNDNLALLALGLSWTIWGISDNLLGCCGLLDFRTNSVWYEWVWSLFNCVDGLTSDSLAGWIRFGKENWRGSFSDSDWIGLNLDERI